MRCPIERSGGTSAKYAVTCWLLYNEPDAIEQNILEKGRNPGAGPTNREPDDLPVRKAWGPGRHVPGSEHHLLPGGQSHPTSRGGHLRFHPHPVTCHYLQADACGIRPQHLALPHRGVHPGLSGQRNRPLALPPTMERQGFSHAFSRVERPAGRPSTIPDANTNIPPQTAAMGFKNFSIKLF